MKTGAKNLKRLFNTTSIADAAFLILIFFLVATTTDFDTSLYRTQSFPSNQPTQKLKGQKPAAIQASSNYQLTDKDNEIPLSILRQITKQSHINSQNKENQPKKGIVSIEPIGKIKISHLKTTPLYSVNYPCIVSLNL